jgi:hypothetical protein
MVAYLSLTFIDRTAMSRVNRLVYILERYLMSDYLKSYAEEINSKFRRLNHLISHAISIGTYHEIVLKNLLEKFISKRFGVKTGFILNPSTKAVSKQIDILIVDENDPAPYFFVEGDFVVVKPDSVVAAVEVKSVLDKNHFLSAMENAVRFRNTGARGTFSVFAYTCASNDLATISGWYEAVDKKSDSFFNYPNCIFILETGYFQLLSSSIAENWGHYFMRADSKDVKADTLVMSYLLTTIVKAVEMRAGKDGNPFEDFGIAESSVEHMVYRFGSKRVLSSINLTGYPGK